MRILMLTDRMDVGGAETHVFELARALTLRGHRVIVASSGGASARALKKEGIPHLTLPLDKKGAFCTFESYFLLLSLIKSEKIDLIHAHARFPALLASFLSKQSGVPFVSTAHAKFSPLGVRRRFSCWGIATVAVSEDIKQHLIDAYGVYSPNIFVIPNCMDTEKFSPISCENRPLTVGFLSRLDYDCSLGARLLCRIAPALVKGYGRIRIVIGGGGEAYRDISDAAKRVNRRLGFECIECVGRVDDTPRFFRRLDVFVGVSRAACEAALCGSSVILCGDEGFMGRLTGENFEVALAGNFCARGYKKAGASELLSEINALLNDKNRDSEQEKIRKNVSERCDVKRVSLLMERFYKNAVRKYESRGNAVLLCGYYGFSNVGDDALLRASYERARREFEGCKISALTKNGRRDEKKFVLKCVNRNSLSALFSLISCRYFVLGGGTLLQDRTSFRSLLYYTTLLRMARFFGAECHLWGNGIGELCRPLSVKLTKKALSSCSYVGVRDERSKKVAEELLRGKNSVICAEKDLACELLPCGEARADEILKKLFGGAKISEFILVSVKRVPDGRILRAISEAKNRGYSVIFAVMHEGEDLAASRSLSKKVGGKLLRDVSFEELVALAKKSKGVYSMRLHALIAARLAGVSAHAFGEDGKIQKFASGEMYIQSAKRTDR